MHEKHAYRLIRDLFAHKEAIFGELKRASALSHTPSGGNASNAARMRAISTDESNRRANMEARNRAIASKSRNSSPAPHANGGRSHRRDRSSDPPSTRFPIHTSPPAGEGRRGQVRASLEVPPDNSSPVTTKSTSTIPEHSYVAPDNTPPASSYVSDTNAVTSAPPEAVNGLFSEKRDSLGRSSRFPTRKTGGQGSLGANRMSGGTNSRDSVGSEAAEHRGVELRDRPMDD